VSREQKIRAVLFYLSVCIFFAGLPFILTFTLGYQFDPRTFKFTTTGLISLKTQPAGASVLLNGKLFSEKTPCSLNELLPGTYRVELTLEDYYPYTADVEVLADRVSRMEKIILFQLRPDIQQLNKERFSQFWIDESRGVIFYVNRENDSIYRSDMAGEHLELIAQFTPLMPAPKKWLLSFDREKMLYFNIHQIAVLYLPQDKKHPPEEKPVILNYPADAIQDAFWYSDNYHLIVVTDKKIDVIEANPSAAAVTIVNLNKKNSSAFYDPRNDSLYFSDSQKAADGNFYDNLYRLELKKRLYPFQELMGIKTNE
jgi:hypothetical protein